MLPNSTRTSRRRVTSAAASAFEPLEKRELMSAGQLDTTFGTGGKFASQALPFTPLALAVQKDGKTLAIGSFATNFAVARINGNGTIDTAFGPRGDGVAQANFGSGTDTPHGIAVQADGKIVLVGEDADHHMAVARFDSAGMLDRAFNNGLKEFGFHTFDGAGAIAFAVAIQSDGKILVAGQEDDSGLIGSRDDDFAVARLNANGSLDDSFGDDGKMHFGMGGNRERVISMYVQTDKKIIVGGDTNTKNGRRFAVARLKSNGDLDKTFDGDGKSIADFGTDATMASITPGPLDSIIAVGCANNDYAMARFRSGGPLDFSFGNGTGMVTTDVSGTFDLARTAIITPDNQILVGGLSNGNFGIVRYDIAGNIDTTFGTNGTVNTGFGATESVYKLSTTPDGKVVALGASMANLVLQARYTATQPKVGVTSSRNVTDEGRADAAFTFTRDQALSFPTRVYYSLGGTATLNADYTGPTFVRRIKDIGNIGVVTRGFPLGGKIDGSKITGGTITIGGGGGAAFGNVPFVDIPAGEAQATVTIKALDDSKLEPNETITATISDDALYTHDTGAAETVTIRDDDVVHVNFQAVSSQGATRYVRDTGKKFDDRGNGLSYGWDKNNANKMRIRNSAGSPDFRYDSLALMQAGGANRKWEIAVPNGRYEVRLVAGDPNFTDSKYKMNLEGQLALSGTPGGDVHWFRSTSIVDVTDGRLTLTNASGAQNNKIAWIDIKAAPIGAATGPLMGAFNLPVLLFSDTTQGTRGNDGLFSDTQIDDRSIWVELRRISI
jgi:uncharacterized delta-60 repeat protein